MLLLKWIKRNSSFCFRREITNARLYKTYKNIYVTSEYNTTYARAHTHLYFFIAPWDLSSYKRYLRPLQVMLELYNTSGGSDTCVDMYTAII